MEADARVNRGMAVATWKRTCAELAANTGLNLRFHGAAFAWRDLDLQVCHVHVLDTRRAGTGSLHLMARLPLH